MSDESPLVEIPEQPLPTIPETATEQVDPADLGADLEAIKLQERITEYERKVHDLEVERVMLEQRKTYASRLFDLSGYWLLFIGAFLLMAGWGAMKVADSVLIALITTTTANVLGLFYIVARWLFPNKNTNDSKEQSKNDNPS